MNIYFIHPFVKDISGMSRYIPYLPSKIQWNSENPDVLFVSEWIYYKKKYFLEFRKLYDRAKIKVFLSGEAIEPDFNIFDYAIGFDDKLFYSDRFIRNMSPLDFFSSFLHGGINDIDSIDKARLLYRKKNCFCNFLYSNPDAHPMRDRLFFELSQYKHVDSLGKHLNNVREKGTGFVGHAGDCTRIKSNYRFSIASENASYSGYTSEKILTSLEAHTIPIYWGNPNIIDDVNPECFINVRDYDSFESLRKCIAEIDTNEELWCEYISKPWFTESQIQKHRRRTDNYNLRIAQLLDKNDIAEKRRVAEGTHVDLYRKHYLKNIYPLQINKTNLPLYFHKLVGKLLMLN